MAEAIGNMLAKIPIKISPPNMPKIDDKKAVAKVAMRIMVEMRTLMALGKCAGQTLIGAIVIWPENEFRHIGNHCNAALA